MAGNWKNLVETAREASKDMETGDKRFAFFMLVGITACSSCAIGCLFWLFNRKG